MCKIRSCSGICRRSSCSMIVWGQHSMIPDSDIELPDWFQRDHVGKTAKVVQPADTKHDASIDSPQQRGSTADACKHRPLERDPPTRTVPATTGQRRATRFNLACAVQCTRCRRLRSSSLSLAGLPWKRLLQANASPSSKHMILVMI